MSLPEARALGSKVTVTTDSARGFHDAMVALERQFVQEWIDMGQPKDKAVVITVGGDGRSVSGEVRAASAI
jgi:hypothetical protein